MLNPFKFTMLGAHREHGFASLRALNLVDQHTTFDEAAQLYRVVLRDVLVEERRSRVAQQWFEEHKKDNPDQEWPNRPDDLSHDGEDVSVAIEDEMTEQERDAVRARVIAEV
jgi:hypothetical protein